MVSILMLFEFEGKKVEIERPIKVKELLKKLSLSGESHLVVVNGNLLTEDDIVRNGDNVRIIKVVSGG